MQARSVDTLQQVFLQTVLAQSDQLSDVTQGSVLSALARSIAGTQGQQELKLLDLAASFYLATATQQALELRAADYGLSRKPGAPATGSVLALSQTEVFTVDPNTILTEPNTGLQYQLATTYTTTVTSFSEARIPISGTSYGELSNLPAGTRLISPTYPQVSFLVGSHRTTGGSLCGDLSGGRDAETDEQLRSRVSASILSSRGTTADAIKTVLLAEPTVNWVSLQIPTAGLIQVWVDSVSLLTATELARLQAIATLAKPAGLLLYLYQAGRTEVDINLYVKPDSSVDLHQLTATLIGLVHDYLLSLDLNQPFSRATLLAQMSQVSGVLESAVLLPAADTAPALNAVLRSSKVWVTYDTI